MQRRAHERQLVLERPGRQKRLQQSVPRFGTAVGGGFVEIVR